MEIKDIDHEELFKQMEEQAIKSGDYIMFKAFIGGDMDNPLSTMIMGKSNAYQMIQLMCVLKHILEELAKTYPELYAEALKADVQTITHQEHFDNSEEDIDDVE